MIERSPLKSRVARIASALQPTKMSQSKFDLIAERLYESGLLSSTAADKAKKEMETLLNKVVKKDADKFNKFNFKTDRIDEFFGLLVNEPQYSNHWNVMRFVFFLPHGQC